MKWIAMLPESSSEGEKKIDFFVITTFHRFFNPHICGIFEAPQILPEVSPMQRRKTVMLVSDPPGHLGEVASQ